MSSTDERAGAETYDQKLRRWTKDGEGDDTAVFEDEVWWGYWRMVGGEDVNPPDALFPTKEEAEAFAALVGERYDWHIGPCVLTIATREVPEPS